MCKLFHMTVRIYISLTRLRDYKRPPFIPYTAAPLACPYPSLGTSLATDNKIERARKRTANDRPTDRRRGRKFNQTVENTSNCLKRILSPLNWLAVNHRRPSNNSAPTINTSQSFHHSHTISIHLPRPVALLL